MSYKGELQTLTKLSIYQVCPEISSKITALYYGIFSLNGCKLIEHVSV